MMTWNYISGFFDGEGSLVHNNKGFRIFIPQTNEQVLTAIKRFAGFGYVMKVKKRKIHWKDSWVYYIAKQEDIYKFLNKVKDHVIVKREKVLSAIPKLKIKLVEKSKREKLSTERKIMVKKLRVEGLTYREIGRKIGIDFGHARRLNIK